MEKRSLSQQETKLNNFAITAEYFGENWCFSKAFNEQFKRFEDVSLNNGKTHILSGVHKATFTLGNSLKSEETLPLNFVQTDRGGRVMYHGPGQLTIYPIFKLNKYFKGPRKYTEFLFDSCIEYFEAHHNILLTCKNSGLWTKAGKKVGFVGLRIKEGVCYHGLSINYSTDLNAFLEHSPCDISGDQAGNLFEDHKKCPRLEEEAVRLTQALVAGLTLQRSTLR